MRKTKRFEHFRHAKTRLRYHLIFSTKYRHAYLNPIREDLLECMKETEKKCGTFEIEVMEVNKDHIHFLIRIDPKECVTNVVRALKQNSTYWMWQKHREYLKKFYWKEHHLWTRGYFISTIGECSSETIRKYIENQG